MAELSPLMQQYIEIKNQHKDEILFYRIGDFYEMFFDDALTVSKELDLTLTGKQCGLEERAPMCGVPFHSYENYVARLIAKGYKVAICEQMEDPAKAKGLVKRDIIRVVTPGTVIESSMLQDDRNNYIASIYLKGKKAGLCFADVSTGTAHITELSADKIASAVITELCRYHPSEVLMNPGLLDCREVTAYIKKSLTCSVELIEDERYAPGLVSTALEGQFGRSWAQATGIAEDGLVRFAMAALLEYLHDTQIKGVERLKTVITYNKAQFMWLSSVTRANLELTETLRGREKRGTLLWVLDKTRTSMGKRLLRGWIEQPLLSSTLINRRLNAVESLVKQTIVRGDLIDELENNGLKKTDVKLPKQTLEAIIESYTRESGVRELEKKIGKILRKVARQYATEGTLPKAEIKPEDLYDYLGVAEYTRDKYQGNDYAGVVTGLAWTAVGGEILFVETSLSRGKGGRLTLTGNLGDVMKESAMLALEYIKAHASLLGLDEEIFDNWNIHIHVPEGAIPKDGPSAGITMATSLASALTQRKVKANLAMTGEITLRGRVLPVGGIKEKILAAKRAGIKEIILSEEHRKNIDEIQDIYLKGLTFHYVKDVKEVFAIALTDEKVADPLDLTVKKDKEQKEEA